MTPKHDVFISYSRKASSEFANALRLALEQAQLEVWMDRGGIASGFEWEREIQKALQSCRVMLLVISQLSMDSENVQDEIATAIRQGVPILPVQVEELRPDTEYPMRLNRVQWMDVKEDQSQEKLDEIVAATRRVLNAKSPSPIAEAQAEQNITVAASVNQTQESFETSDPALLISKAEFLSQCKEGERSYFEDVLAYGESHVGKIIIDWGTKGFSIKDSNRRQILWMFPQEGANSKSNINARLQKLTDEEKAQIIEILRSNGITKGLSWRPGDLPLLEIKKIIALVCGI